MIKKIKKLKYNSVLIQTDSQEELSDMFMRFQEHYENPKFKGQIFTIGILKRWYSETYGADTYTRDWEGFNFPSYVLKPFRDGLFDPLTDREQKLLDLLRYRDDNFYVIGANDDTVIRHELAHALFNYDKEYANKIETLYKKNIQKFKLVNKYLLDKGYHYDVLCDEIQAYVTDNDDDYIKKNLDTKLIVQINAIYEKYS